MRPPPANGIPAAPVDLRRARRDAGRGGRDRHDEARRLRRRARGCTRARRGAGDEQRPEDGAERQRAERRARCTSSKESGRESDPDATAATTSGRRSGVRRGERRGEREAEGREHDETVERRIRRSGSNGARTAGASCSAVHASPSARAARSPNARRAQPAPRSARRRCAGRRRRAKGRHERERRRRANVRQATGSSSIDHASTTVATSGRGRRAGHEARAGTSQRPAPVVLRARPRAGRRRGRRRCDTPALGEPEQRPGGRRTAPDRRTSARRRRRARTNARRRVARRARPRRPPAAQSPRRAPARRRARRARSRARAAASPRRGSTAASASSAASQSRPRLWTRWMPGGGVATTRSARRERPAWARTRPAAARTASSRLERPAGPVRIAASTSSTIATLSRGASSSSRTISSPRRAEVGQWTARSGSPSTYSRTPCGSRPLGRRMCARVRLRPERRVSVNSAPDLGHARPDEKRRLRRERPRSTVATPSGSRATRRPGPSGYRPRGTASTTSRARPPRSTVVHDSPSGPTRSRSSSREAEPRRAAHRRRPSRSWPPSTGGDARGRRSTEHPRGDERPAACREGGDGKADAEHGERGRADHPGRGEDGECEERRRRSRPSHRGCEGDASHRHRRSRRGRRRRSPPR